METEKEYLAKWLPDYSERVKNFSSDEYITMTRDERKTFAVGECDSCRWNGADKLLIVDGRNQENPSEWRICDPCAREFFHLGHGHVGSFLTDTVSEIVDIPEWNARQTYGEPEYPKNDGRI